jgi:hypothetical protein
MNGTVENTVRLALYSSFVEKGTAPSAAELAGRLSMPEEAVRGAMEALAAGKAIVLQPESREVLMANPLCAVATPYRAVVDGKAFFSACVWDGLGAIAMLGDTGVVESSCACCGEAMEVRVENGVPVDPEGVIHFAVPAKRWWENIVFT